MNIYTKPGTKIKFNGDLSQEQINWGSYEDPRSLLEKGQIYTVEKTEVHSFHTKVFLTDFPDKSFNSVWFEEI